MPNGPNSGKSPEQPDTENDQFSGQDLVAIELRKVLLLANKMTLADSSQRQLLFELTKAPIRSLLEINEQDFGQSGTIRNSVSMLARALLKLRNLGEGQIATLDLDHPIDCPYCDTKITRLNPDDAGSPSSRGAEPTEANQWYVYCGKCSFEYTQALQRLSSKELGFGVEAD